MTNPSDLLAGLPGEALVRQGLVDFESGQDTIPAFLVGMARTRLRRAGVLAVSVDRNMPEAELGLYRLLRRQGGDAYSRFNALVRELVSFERALDSRLIRRAQAIAQ